MNDTMIFLEMLVFAKGGKFGDNKIFVSESNLVDPVGRHHRANVFYGLDHPGRIIAFPCFFYYFQVIDHAAIFC